MGKGCWMTRLVNLLSPLNIFEFKTAAIFYISILQTSNFAILLFFHPALSFHSCSQIPVSSVGKFRTGRTRRVPFLHTEHLAVITKVILGLELVWEREERVNGRADTFETFQPGKQDYIFGRSVHFGNFSVGRNKKSIFQLHSNRNFRNLLVNGKQSLSQVLNDT